MIYPAQECNDTSQYSWISIEKTQTRLELLKKIETLGDWEEVRTKIKGEGKIGQEVEFTFNDNSTMSMTIDSEDSRILEEIYRSSKVELRATSNLIREITAILTFNRLPTEIMAALDSLHLSYQQRLYTVIFYVISACVDFVSVLLTLMFPFAFFFLFFWVPACY